VYNNIGLEPKHRVKLCIGNLKFGEMESGEMKRNTSRGFDSDSWAFLFILGQCLRKHLPDIILLYLLIRDLTSHNNFQQEVKVKELITVIIALLVPNSTLLLC